MEESQDQGLKKDRGIQDDPDHSDPSEATSQFQGQDEADDDADCHVDDERDQKSEEAGVVLTSDAVIEENAVVVEVLDASVAGSAVVALLRDCPFAPEAMFELFVGLRV